jgi:hypothetical protein
MAYCPECGAEFGIGIRRCPECRVDLLEELNDPSFDDVQDLNLVVVREGLSSQEANHIKTNLEKNGILCVVESSRLGKPASLTQNLQILVNLKDEDRCRQLMVF